MMWLGGFDRISHYFFSKLMMGLYFSRIELVIIIRNHCQYSDYVVYRTSNF